MKIKGKRLDKIYSNFSRNFPKLIGINKVAMSVDAVTMIARSVNRSMNRVTPILKVKRQRVTLAISSDNSKSRRLKKHRNRSWK